MSGGEEGVSGGSGGGGSGGGNVGKSGRGEGEEKLPRVSPRSLPCPSVQYSQSSVARGQGEEGSTNCNIPDKGSSGCI